MGFKVVATRGTKRYLEANGIQCDAINKVLEGRPHIVDAMKNGDIHLVFNTTEGSKALSDSKDIRRTALLHHIPYYTTLSGAVAVTRAIKALKSDTLRGVSTSGVRASLSRRMQGGRNATPPRSRLHRFPVCQPYS